MNRVCVLGPPGSGKSTLARRLAAAAGLPVVHLDVLFWKPGWVESDQDDFDARVLDVARGDRWVIDGNYSRTMPQRLQRADLIVFLDFPRWRCLARILKRRVMFARRPRPDMTQGCHEKITAPFWSFAWHWPVESRQRRLRVIAEHAGRARVVTLGSPRAVRRFLASAAARSAPSARSARSAPIVPP